MKTPPELANLATALPKTAAETVELPKLDYQKIVSEDAQSLVKPQGLRVSVHREVQEDLTGKWNVIPRNDGRFSFRIVIHSPGAGFIRPHFSKPPKESTQLYLYGEGGASLTGPITKPAASARPDFWGPQIPGEHLFVEVVQDSPDETPELGIDRISHGYLDPISLKPLDSSLPQSTPVYSCYPDVNCYSWADELKTGVARMYFEKNGGGYACTGALLVDKAGSFRNWFLTANHCISDDYTANSLIAYFQYWSSYCNGPAPSISTVPSANGASFRVGESLDVGSDFTLLELWEDPPGGTYYLGWSTSDISPNTSVAGIHHPAGDYQRISFGSGSSPYSGFQDFWEVVWSQGTTEPGSSGSPLFSYATNQIIGQLYGVLTDTGAGTCGSPYHSIYGKFGVSWNDGLKNYLNSAPCTYSLTATSASYGSSSQTGSVSVNTQSSCAWSAQSNASWISVTAGSSGYGNGTVSYSVAANTSSSSRSGTLTIAGQTYTVTQGGGTTFADVSPSSVYAPYINALASAGITQGCGGGNYCPSADVTRGQMAAFIERSLRGEYFSYSATPYFSDVPATNVYFKYVQRLKDDGITAVTGSYDVNGYVTRGQMAAFLVRSRFGDTFSYTQTPYFSDVPASNVFFKYVQKLKDTGITAAVGTYNVDSDVTREQMAAFLSRAFLGMQ